MLIAKPNTECKLVTVRMVPAITECEIYKARTAEDVDGPNGDPCLFRRRDNGTIRPSEAFGI